MLTDGFCKFTPRSLFRPQRDTHLVELHNCGIGADSLSWPLSLDPDQILHIGVWLWLPMPVVVLEEAADALSCNNVVAHWRVHLLISGHHMCDPAWFARFWGCFFYLLFEILHLLWDVHWVSLLFRITFYWKWNLGVWQFLLFVFFIFAVLNSDCDFFVLCDHFTPEFIQFAQWIGYLVVLVLNDEALIL